MLILMTLKILQLIKLISIVGLYVCGFLKPITNFTKTHSMPLLTLKSKKKVIRSLAGAFKSTNVII